MKLIYFLNIFFDLKNGLGKFKNLPIIAITAKAMNDDKKNCIDAGANDHIAKPVDVVPLLLLMSV